jgi:hypothetical protein
MARKNFTQISAEVERNQNRIRFRSAAAALIELAKVEAIIVSLASPIRTGNENPLAEKAFVTKKSPEICFDFSAPHATLLRLEIEADEITMSAPFGRVDLEALKATKARRKGAER